ncbi:MAG: hypothetical protein LBO21_06050 [Synergistaceae bacterium]|jgi:hypothetical protein|nr:hypothetical protein [Synergistaceae bacterium]
MGLTNGDGLSALSLEAIRTAPTDEEREAAYRSPYPTSQCHLAFERAALAARYWSGWRRSNSGRTA